MKEDVNNEIGSIFCCLNNKRPWRVSHASPCLQRKWKIRISLYIDFSAMWRDWGRQIVVLCDDCHWLTICVTKWAMHKKTSLLRGTSKLESWFSDIITRGVKLSKQQTIKVLIRLGVCAGWPAHLLFAYGINSFSHDMPQIISIWLLSWH